MNNKSLFPTYLLPANRPLIKGGFHISFSVCFCLSGFTAAHLSDFKRELNSVVLKDMRSNKDNISVTVLAVDITQKESKETLLFFNHKM